ncbi:MAG: GNAT family N-acetyltransferase [Chloroflexota bacterium]
MRTITEDEFLPFARMAALGFGEPTSDEDLEHERPMFNFERSLGVFDQGRVVGTGLIYEFELTLPGLTFTPAAGVSWITVLPTHRRRGILRSMMMHQFADMRERDEPLGLLYSSESIIYGRFGYGVATSGVRLEIERRHGAFAHSPPEAGGMRIIEKEEAQALLPPLFDRLRRLRPGEVNRFQSMWDFRFRDLERWRQGASAMMFAVHEGADGEPDGFLVYRIKEKWEMGIPRNVMQVQSLIAANAGAYTALWRYCLDMDLVETVELAGTPDEPLRWMLADPRRMRVVSADDQLWARLIDIPKALAARRYRVEDRLVLEISDAVCPENSGRYRLEGGPEGAECKRVSDDPDISMKVADLSAAYLGGVGFGVLARADRVHERTHGAIQRADALFGIDPLPSCSTGF